MPPRKKKFKAQDGREVEGTVMPFQTGVEHWNEYFVEDGTVLRIKLVATEIIRLDGQFDANDDPVYILASSNVMTTSAREDLRKGSE